MTVRVLLVEDDAVVRETTALVLGRMQIESAGAADGRAALDLLAGGDPFDLVVLDLMLPGMDGLDVCREIRRTSRIPIVMLSARDDITDVVSGLELGADDYVTKPFDGRELAARIRALLRRSSRPPTDGRGDADHLVRVRDLVIDLEGHRVEREGRDLALTTTEFKLLTELALHAGNVLTRGTLLERVWDTGYLGDSRLVDMAVKRLRQKLDDDAHNARYITTVRGAGYRFERN